MSHLDGPQHQTKVNKHHHYQQQGLQLNVLGSYNVSALMTAIHLFKR